MDELFFDYFDHDLDESCIQDYRPQQMYRNTVYDLTRWQCKDGTIWPVSNMTDSHLKNAIGHLKRNKPSSPMLPVLEAEYRERSETT